jgi:hypothetical protein
LHGNVWSSTSNIPEFKPDIVAQKKQQAQLAIACLRRFGEAVQSPARALTQEAGPSDQSL